MNISEVSKAMKQAIYSYIFFYCSILSILHNQSLNAIMVVSCKSHAHPRFLIFTEKKSVKGET